MSSWSSQQWQNQSYEQPQQQWQSYQKAKGKGKHKKKSWNDEEQEPYRKRLPFKDHFSTKSIRPYSDEEKSFMNTYTGNGMSSRKVKLSTFLAKDNLKNHLNSSNTELRRRPEYGLTEIAQSLRDAAEVMKSLRPEDLTDLMGTLTNDNLSAAVETFKQANPDGKDIHNAVKKFSKHVEEEPEAFTTAAKLAPLFAAGYVSCMNILDVHIAFGNMKRWAGLTNSEGFKGESLEKWKQAPKDLKKLADFLAEAIPQKLERVQATADNYSEDEGEGAKPTKKGKKKSKKKSSSSSKPSSSSHKKKKSDKKKPKKKASTSDDSSKDKKNKKGGKTAKNKRKQRSSASEDSDDKKQKPASDNVIAAIKEAAPEGNRKEDKVEKKMKASSSSDSPKTKKKNERKSKDKRAADDVINAKDEAAPEVPRKKNKKQDYDKEDVKETREAAFTTVRISTVQELLAKLQHELENVGSGQYTTKTEDVKEMFAMLDPTIIKANEKVSKDWDELNATKEFSSFRKKDMLETFIGFVTEIEQFHLKQSGTAVASGT